jgi:hypothetical protein
MAVQVSLMANVMDGVNTIVGRGNRASSLFIRLAHSLDDCLKAGLCLEKTRELLRKYEKIMLDEHFTNLYAPRILAQQQQEEVTAPSLLSVRDTRKGVVGRMQDRLNMEISKVYLGVCVQLYSLAETPQLSPTPPAFGLIYGGAIGQPR